MLKFEEKKSKEGANYKWLEETRSSWDSPRVFLRATVKNIEGKQLVCIELPRQEKGTTETSYFSASSSRKEFDKFSQIESKYPSIDPDIVKELKSFSIYSDRNGNYQLMAFLNAEYPISEATLLNLAIGGLGDHRVLTKDLSKDWAPAFPDQIINYVNELLKDARAKALAEDPSLSVRFYRDAFYRNTYFSDEAHALGADITLGVSFAGKGVNSIYVSVPRLQNPTNDDFAKQDEKVLAQLKSIQGCLKQADIEAVIENPHCGLCSGFYNGTAHSGIVMRLPADIDQKQVLDALSAAGLVKEHCVAFAKQSADDPAYSNRVYTKPRLTLPKPGQKHRDLQLVASELLTARRPEDFKRAVETVSGAGIDLKGLVNTDKYDEKERPLWAFPVARAKNDMWFIWGALKDAGYDFSGSFEGRTAPEFVSNYIFDKDNRFAFFQLLYEAGAPFDKKTLSDMSQTGGKFLTLAENISGTTSAALAGNKQVTKLDNGEYVTKDTYNLGILLDDLTRRVESYDPQNRDFPRDTVISSLHRIVSNAASGLRDRDMGRINLTDIATIAALHKKDAEKAFERNEFHTGHAISSILHDAFDLRGVPPRDPSSGQSQAPSSVARLNRGY